MGDTNDAVKKLGRFAVLAGLHVHPHLLYFANQAVEFHKLVYLSGRSPDEIKHHLAHWPGSLESMRAFYAQYNCFPCELKLDNEGLKWLIHK